MSKKEEKKGLMKRLVEREEVNLADYTMNEIEEVIKELVELRVDRVTSPTPPYSVPSPWRIAVPNAGR